MWLGSLAGAAPALVVTVFRSIGIKENATGSKYRDHTVHTHVNRSRATNNRKILGKSDMLSVGLLTRSLMRNGLSFEFMFILHKKEITFI